MLRDPPYNLLIHSAPLDEPAGDFYHWHVEIIPKLTKVAGFEWATGFYRESDVARRSGAGPPRRPRLILWECLGPGLQPGL